MQVIKDRAIAETTWRLVGAGDEPLPDGDIIVPLARFIAERERLLGRDTELGVKLNSDSSIDEIAEDLDHFSLIALEFPTFVDGRSFSLARILRDRHAYKGDVLAVGDVLRDQLFFMQRCGINMFRLREDQDMVAALSAFEDFSVRYQPAADDALPIYRYR